VPAIVFQVGDSNTQQLLHKVVSDMSGLKRSVEDCTAKVDTVACNMRVLATRAPQVTLAAATPSAPSLQEFSSTEPPRKKRTVQISLLNTLVLQTPVAGALATSADGECPPPTVEVEAAKLSISKLFVQWYEHKLFVRHADKPQGYHTLMLLCARVICYAKRFLKHGTVLTALPSAASAHDAWRCTMRALAAQAERGIMEHILRT
jgi:hypothetical protein